MQSRRLTIAQRLKQRIIDEQGAIRLDSRGGSFVTIEEEPDEVGIDMDPPEESYVLDKEYIMDVARKRGVK